MWIYVNNISNISNKFHTNPIWNDRALGIFSRSPQQQEHEE